MHGFYNLGNTCYFNSAIQAIFSIDALCDEILNTEIKDGKSFIRAFKDLLYFYKNQTNPCSINVKPLLEEFQKLYPRFTMFEQHDAQDVLFCIFDIIENEIPYLKKLFTGSKCQETIYPNGSNKISQDYNILLLDGHDNDNINQMISNSEKWNTLTDYVDDKGVKYNVSATRNVITRVPNILFISFNSKTRVQIDEIDGYELKSSILHIGSHYIAMIKKDNQWYIIDDDKVTMVDFPNISNHHVLIYSMKS